MSWESFIKSAVCHSGDGVVSAENLYWTVQNPPLTYSGTSVALFQLETRARPLLVKVFSRNWSRHSQEFCNWAYGHTLRSEEIFGLSRSLKLYIQGLCNYGINVDIPLAVWEILDPFQKGVDERSLLIVVQEYTEPSIRRRLFELRHDNAQVVEIFRDHIDALLQLIQTAEQLGDITEYTITYGVDLKPRNLVLAETWTYIDLFPILTPDIQESYREKAPEKAFMKRFDTRYYIFDLLFRYYKIVPALIDTLHHIAKVRIVDFLGGEAGEYNDFVSQYLMAYLAKWGHMPPDKDWRHPFRH